MLGMNIFRGSQSSSTDAALSGEARLRELRAKHKKGVPGWPRAIRRSYVELRVQNELMVELLDETRGLRRALESKQQQAE